MTRKRLFLFTIVVLLVGLVHDDASAQRRRKRNQARSPIYDLDTLMQPIPAGRVIFHNNINSEQRKADASDGKVDNIIFYSEDTAITYSLTRAVLRDVDRMQTMIENLPTNGYDPAIDNQTKIKYLKAVWEMMRGYNANTRIDPVYYRRLISNMRDMIIASHESKTMPFFKENISVYTLDNSKHLFASGTEERGFIYSEMGKREPEMMIDRLGEYASEPFADEIIAAAARVVPSQVFNFASSTNYTLSGAISRTKDPLVQTIVRIVRESKAPLKAMPFLSDIHNNKKTIAEIDKITADQDEFFLNLVRLKLENEQLAGNTYTDELRYRSLKYVRDMNDLHDSPDAVRFKSIDKFSPEALYFIMVYGQDEIYTSSFLGTFKRMVERMKPMKGDELLAKVHRDHFRTFIRMCAGYNTISQFLGTMEPDNKTALMKDFIAGLEKGKEHDLEDAVDVADAFGSLRDSALITFLENEVKVNYENAYKLRSRKGVIVYGLLATLFEGMKTSDNQALARQQSEKLSLPPITLVPNRNLRNDSGVVYQQFFFYGDDDGKSSYNSFLGNFDRKKWKVVSNAHFTTLTSTSGKPVVIYANLPLTEPKDEEAQSKLEEYLTEKGIKPTIMVHRGHSYHLPVTMEYLVKESKIVILGSCGGYHNLGAVLDRAPDAHIISSKQVGSMSVNEPIVKAINDQLLEGKDIDWINTWKTLEAQFTAKRNAKAKELFDDYIPPHKNLGAIFIKAYRRQFATDDEESEG
ncbi:MAG: hypothetical protein EOP56_15240 [Sphingobacteriales bacterium]|nr:MAG: hypothetical protein EOP56_15240 [Sphingobacteriales bacterium]